MASIRRTATASSPGPTRPPCAGHTGGDIWVADAAIEMMDRRDLVGDVRDAWARSTRPRTCGARRPTPPTSRVIATIPTWRSGARTRRTFGARRRSPTCSWGRSWMPSRRSTRPTAGRPWWCSPPTTVRRTAGTTSTGRRTVGHQQQQLVLRARRRVGRGFTLGARAQLPRDTSHIYNQPSPALQPLIDTGNVQFSYQSTAVETWLDRSLGREEEGGRGRDARGCPA